MVYAWIDRATSLPSDQWTKHRTFRKKNLFMVRFTGNSVGFCLYFEIITSREVDRSVWKKSYTHINGLFKLKGIPLFPGIEPETWKPVRFVRIINNTFFMARRSHNDKN